MYLTKFRRETQFLGSSRNSTYILREQKGGLYNRTYSSVPRQVEKDLPRLPKFVVWLPMFEVPMFEWVGKNISISNIGRSYCHSYNANFEALPMNMYNYTLPQKGWLSRVECILQRSSRQKMVALHISKTQAIGIR